MSRVGGFLETIMRATRHFLPICFVQPKSSCKTQAVGLVSSIPSLLWQSAIEFSLPQSRSLMMGLRNDCDAVAFKPAVTPLDCRREICSNHYNRRLPLFATQDMLRVYFDVLLSSGLGIQRPWLRFSTRSCSVDKK